MRKQKNFQKIIKEQGQLNINEKVTLYIIDVEPLKLFPVIPKFDHVHSMLT